MVQRAEDIGKSECHFVMKWIGALYGVNTQPERELTSKVDLDERNDLIQLNEWRS